MQVLGQYWFQIVTLPSKVENPDTQVPTRCWAHVALENTRKLHGREGLSWCDVAARSTWMAGECAMAVPNNSTYVRLG